MGTIETLIQSITQMSTKELLDKVRDVRATRNVTEKVERKEKKERAKRKVKEGSAILSAFNKLSPEEKAALMSEFSA